MCSCVFRDSGQRGRPHDDAGLEHGEGSLLEVAEESRSAAAGGRAHRVVRVHQELLESQIQADV